MELTIVVSLMLLAIILLLIEMFLIPGISVAGIGGAVAAVVSVVLAFRENTVMGWITLSFGVLMMVLLGWVFFKSKALDKMSLQTTIDGSVGAVKELDINEGDEGISVSRLAPMGKVRINGKTIEAKTTGEFIDEDTAVVVEKVFETNILVKSKN